MKTRMQALCALAVAASMSVAGCGNVDSSENPTGAAGGSSAEKPDATWSDGQWLLRFNTAGGKEGETAQAVYVRFTPSSGATTVRKLPGLISRDTYSDSQALMISADHQYALLDSRVKAADRKQGRLTLYPIDTNGTVKVDVRGWSKAADLTPVAAAFDPAEAGLLRVVDNKLRVWLVNLTEKSAEQDGELPRRGGGWIYANGFDKNTGVPYIESINTAKTVPPGNGDDDVRPVDRRGGVVRPFDGPEIPGEPPLPCGFAGGFNLNDGTGWIFCADTPKISAYRLAPNGDAWEKVGVASKAVVPVTAEELPVVLPPVETK